MNEPYTEEDKLNLLLDTSENFRRLFDEFDLELDFSKQPPVKYKRAGGYIHINKKK